MADKYLAQIGPSRAAMLIPSMTNVPTGTAPPGVTTKLGQGYRNSAPIVAGLSFFYAVLLLCLACRVYSKVWLVRRIWWDDAALLIGTLGTTVCVGAVIYEVTGASTGYHSWEVSVAEFSSTGTLTANLVYVWGFAFSGIFVKTSVFLMYWLLFSMIRWLRWFLLILGPILVACQMVWGLLTIVQFTPSPQQTVLQRFLQSYGDYDRQQISLYAYIAAVVTNVILVILPMPAVARMKLHWRRKVGVMIVLSAGLLACAASAADLWYRFDLVKGDPDPVYNLATLDWLSSAQYLMSNCCACAPAIAQTLSYLQLLRPFQKCLSFIPGIETESTYPYSNSTLSDSRSTKTALGLQPTGAASDPKLQATVTTTITRMVNHPAEAHHQDESLAEAGIPVMPTPTPALLFEGNAGIDACRGVTTYISAPSRPKRRLGRRRG